MKPILTDQELRQLKGLIEAASNILICAHRGPDGDAVGSTLAWADYLKQLGKKVEILLPNPFPDFLRWMPNSQNIKFYEKHETEAAERVSKANLIFCLDFNSLGRLFSMQQAVAASNAPCVVIDHHINPEIKKAQLVISHPEMCATAELVFRLVHQLGGFDTMSRHAAVCIYTGMMTDTGGFTYNSSNPEIYEIISLLLTKGFDKDKIYRNVFNVYSTDRMRLTGHILLNKLAFYAGGKASVYTLTREDMKRFNFVRGDAEGLVNMPLQVKGMRLSISLREDTEREVIRVSLRSVDDFDCRSMAEEFFNGGGHFNASGGELPFPMEEAVKTAERAIDAYAHKL